MRVVAGEFGGRRLKAPSGTAVRPTSDRAREALFSILGNVSGADVCDLFCGTGALGIEALSRGARHAVLVDDDTSPAQANVDALGISDRVDLVRRDAFAFLGSGTATFDLILCDPPYTLAARVARDLETLVPARLREGGRLVTESPSHTPMELKLKLEEDRTYGEASLRIWERAVNSEGKERVAVCPGSYDPVTNGHVDIIKRVSRVFDRVVIGVVGQSIRKSSSLFTPEERRGFLERAVAEAELENVEVKIFSNLLVDFVREQNGTAIVKGLRAISDFEYEFEMNQLNRKLAPDIESVYIFASSEFSFLSSTGVKEMATFGGDVSDLVPGEVAKALTERVER